MRFILYKYVLLGGKGTVFVLSVVHESLVCPVHVNCLVFFSPARFFVFQHLHSFAYLTPFQQRLYDFKIHLFTLRMIEGLVHNYYEL